MVGCDESHVLHTERYEDRGRQKVECDVLRAQGGRVPGLRDRLARQVVRDVARLRRGGRPSARCDLGVMYFHERRISVWWVAGGSSSAWSPPASTARPCERQSIISRPGSRVIR